VLFSEEIIRSRQNRTVVELMKLNDRGNREHSRLFRFDGIKLAADAICAGLKIPLLFLKEKNAEEICRFLSQRISSDLERSVGRIVRLDDDLFSKISEEKSPEGVICVAKYIDKIQKDDIIDDSFFLKVEKERVVLLESVRDPSNLGAIIRSAAAMGVDRLIVSSDCADLYNAKTVRASMGTLFTQPISRVENLAETINGLKKSGRRVFAATLTKTSAALGSFPTCKDDCVVIGNEGHGLSEAVVAACGESVFIPMSDRAESFNAAVAASILMWEFFKAQN